MVPSMRVLFSSTPGAGHLQPLLPYARALVARRHEVAVAAPEEVSTVRDAGLPERAGLEAPARREERAHRFSVGDDDTLPG